MSIDTTLDAFITPEETDEEEIVPVFVDYDGNSTDGNTGLSKTCDHCGGQVSDDFHRVFSANDGTLHGCHDCMTGTAIRDGGPARGREYLRAKGVEPTDKHVNGGIKE